MHPRGPLLSRWSADELDRLRQAATREAESAAPGSQQEVLARGDAFFASYCLGETVDAAALRYARACVDRAAERPSLLLVAWRLIVQVPPQELSPWAETVALASEATERSLAEGPTNMLIAEAAIAMRLLRGEIDPAQAQGLVAASAHHQALWALGLPAADAMDRLHERFMLKIRAAEADGRSRAAMSILGPLGWQRGVAWVRLWVDGERIVPAPLRPFFAGFPA